MYLKIDLFTPCYTRCDRCHEHGRCLLLSDDQTVQKRFCVACITGLLQACQAGSGASVSTETTFPPVPVAVPVLTG